MSRKETINGGIRVATALEAAAPLVGSVEAELAGSVEAALVTTLVGRTLVAGLATAQSE